MQKNTSSSPLSNVNPPPNGPKRQLTDEVAEIDNFRDNVYFATYGHQQAYAHFVGMTRVNFNNMLRGENEPRMTTVIRIAKAMRCSVEFLLQDHGHASFRQGKGVIARKWSDPKIDQQEKNRIRRDKRIKREVAEIRAKKKALLEAGEAKSKKTKTA